MGIYTKKEAVVLDCKTIPECHTSCTGPSTALLQAATQHAGCMVEWLFHAGMLKGFTALIMFVLINFSRMVLVRGMVKRYWR
ncbi:unnamed protein product [Choristocarpus tenellus]